MPIYSEHKLGKNPKVTDPRTFKLSRYLDTTAIPLPPASIDYITEVKSWGMLGNDQLGDCVEAAQLHMIEEETEYATGIELVASDEDAIRLYKAEAGYVPGDPNTDQGTVMLDALKYWRRTGILIGDSPTPHKIYAFVTVDLNDTLQVHQAIYLFGGVFFGVELPISAQVAPVNGNGISVWGYRGNLDGGNAAGSWGGHCIPILGYSTFKHRDQIRHRYRVISWGEEFDMTPPFMNAYGSEAYAVLSADWFGTSGLSANQFNMDQLQSDLAAL